MKILTIGATGFIGRHVVSQLLQSGHEVAVLHRGKTALPANSPVTEFLGERAGLQSSGARTWKPDIVIDMILSSAAQARTTVEAFAGIAQRVVAISSGDVYRAMSVLHRIEDGPIEPTPLTEDSPLRTQGQTYSKEALAIARQRLPWLDEEYDKIQVERAVSSHPELPAAILRLPMVYGPGDMFHRFYPRLKRMLDGRSEILLEQTESEWITCRGYVENVAQAICLAASSENASDRIYNVADPDPFTEAQWTAKIGESVHWNGRVMTSPEHLQPPAGNHQQHLFMDSTRIRRELGYSEFVRLQEAIRRTVEWEKANPPEDAAIP
jgi:nucleoside-diphosphate-sugar epimerase